jgi:hypothetical protein
MASISTPVITAIGSTKRPAASQMHEECFDVAHSQPRMRLANTSITNAV